MADAEVIPLGTRGKPGRGTGSAKPSSAARSLAGSTPARKKAAPRPTPRAAARRGRRAPGGRAGRPAHPRAERSPRRLRRPSRPPPAAEAPAASRGSRSGTASPPGASPWATGSRQLTGAAVEVFGDRWEQRLAEFLAFLRRRVTGDFEVDEYGFDAEVTERFLLATVRPLAQKWFRVEVRGAENIPDRRRRPGGLQPLRHRPARRPGHDGLHPRHAPAATCARSAPTWSSGCRSSASWPARAAPPWPATRTPSGCWPAASSSASGPRASRASASPTPTATSCSASAAAASCRRRSAPASRSSRARSSAPRRSTRWSATCRRWPGCSACPTSRSRRSSRCSARSGMVPLPSKWLIEFGEPIRTDAYDEGAADDPMLVFNVTDQVRETIQQTLYTLLMQRRSVFYSSPAGAASGQQAAGARAGVRQDRLHRVAETVGDLRCRRRWSTCTLGVELRPRQPGERGPARAGGGRRVRRGPPGSPTTPTAAAGFDPLAVPCRWACAVAHVLLVGHDRVAVVGLGGLEALHRPVDLGARPGTSRARSTPAGRCRCRTAGLACASMLRSAMAASRRPGCASAGAVG